MALTEQELETMLEKLSQLQEQRDALHAELIQLKLPEGPRVFATNEDAYAFADTLHQLEQRQVILQTSMNSLDQEIYELRNSIREALPLKGVWVKVGRWVAGYCWDVWGGGHYELEIRREGEELPSLADRTRYP